MNKWIHYGFLLFIGIIVSFLFLQPSEVEGSEKKTLELSSSTETVDLYDYLYMLRDNEQIFTIDDIASVDYEEAFILPEEMEQKGGFFEAAKWIRFDVHNTSNQKDWLLEFAFPLIYQIDVYASDENGIVELYKGGTIYPFSQRDIKHRHFLFNLEIEPQTTKTYYALIHGGGDLHPPINIWEHEAFLEKTETEYSLLGLFYGMILIMVLYNLFLYFSLKMKSYLYYVLSILFTMMGQVSLNGLGFQYIWSDFPWWNNIATPFWASLACVFILLFTRNFLDTDQYFPKFKQISYFLIGLNGLVIFSLFVSHIFALNTMLISTSLTFASVLGIGFYCLAKGARQARFFVVGWVFFLVGVFFTILERAAILPFSFFIEYAGQMMLSLEVVLLSLALADKINIIRTEKEKAEQEAKESQKLVLESLKKADELKDEFLTITSHELRTPLYGMIGIAESLRDGVTGDISTETKEQLSMIITSGKRLSHLVNDILDYSKLRHNTLEVELKPVDLVQIVEVVLTICQPLVKDKEIKLINNVAHPLPNVIADQNRLQQILYNLIGNAIKYTDIGEIVVSTEWANDQLEVRVSDTGKGISETYLETIFNPFEQVDVSLSREESGTGIGLSVTKKLVSLHGGEMGVSSKVGEGSTFSFTLPVQKDRDKEKEIAVSLESVETNEPRLTRPNFTTVQEVGKILVADDEQVNLQVLMNQLTLEGYEVITATNGEEVFKLVEEHTVDVLILDIMMPKISGYEVCQRLRKKYSLLELPILMLTAKSQIGDKMTAFEMGANDYLIKPCDKHELLSRVKTLKQLRRMNTELMTLNVRLEEKVKERTAALEVANQDLSKTNADLIEMAESRRNLLANIAHELGTPVMLVHSYVQALQSGLVEMEDSYYSNLVEDKVKVLKRLIDDLSDLSKLDGRQTNLSLSEVNVGNWVQNIYHKLSFDIEHYGRTLNQSIASENLASYSCFIDAERLDQVLANLVSNAVKNTSEKDGEISIQTKLDETAGEIIIQVADNGYGISEQDLPNIFDRFYMAPSQTLGTGLGLAIVKEIIQGHNGKVWAESEENKGSIFYISLPVYEIRE